MKKQDEEYGHSYILRLANKDTLITCNHDVCTDGPTLFKGKLRSYKIKLYDWIIKDFSLSTIS